MSSALHRVLTLPLIDRAHLGRALLLGYLAFSVIYLACGHLHPRPPHLLAEGPLDALIPFLPATIWVYFSQFLLLPAGIALARDDVDRSRTFYAALTATILASVVFLAWPTQVTRQALSETGFTATVWKLLYLADTPANCFPSLHVALSCLAAIALVRRGGAWRMLAPLWTLAVILSTLTTRQHVALDVAGGLALAPVAWVLVGKFFVYERPRTAWHAAGR